MKKILERVDLHNTQAGSDKVYVARLCEVDGGYIVDFAYGRRG